MAQLLIRMRYRPLLLVAIWLLLLSSVRGGDYRKMSPLIRQVCMEFRQRSLSRAPLDGERTIVAFVCICPDEADRVFAKHRCRQHAQWGDIFIASIPLGEVGALSMESAVRRIEASRSSQLCVDTTAAIIQALPLYEASSSHQAYTGKGVLVGIVDVGFDLTHPNFLDPETGHSRIMAFWDQLSRDTIGSLLPVGRDYVGPEAVSAIRQSTDASISTHGTHTLGIAAGSGFDTPYRGIAWGSDLCVVGNAISNNIELIDSADYYKYTNAVDALGFKYCFDYAEQRGMPCVVSLSEGYAPYLDEDDSLYAATLQQLTGPGRIIVAAAGNEGVEKTYFEKTDREREAGSFIRCFKDAALYRMKSRGDMRLAVYGYRKEEDGGRKNERGVPTDTIAFETAEVPVDTVISRQVLYGQDSLTVAVYREGSRFTEHDVWQVLVKSNRTLDQLSPLALVVEGNGLIEVYGNSIYAFRDHEADGRWTAAVVGRNVMAPSCFPGIISVGGTTHRLSIRTADGKETSGSKDKEPGKIGYYSSTGPAMNDLMKPDVVAPGTNVVSSYSQFYHPEKEVVSYSDYNGERYPWGVNSGTSMSAPVVAGVIALWLQARQDLTPQEVREVMSRSCRHPEDQYDYPNNVYGYGEINAYRGLLEVLSLSDIEGISLHQPAGLQVVPDDGGLRLVFGGETPKPLRLSVYHLSGGCVHTCHLIADKPEVFVALPTVSPGIYVIQIDSPDKRLQGSALVRLQKGF